jgi:hypothetical protein
VIFLHVKIFRTKFVAVFMMYLQVVLIQYANINQLINWAKSYIRS